MSTGGGGAVRTPTWAMSSGASSGVGMDESASSVVSASGSPDVVGIGTVEDKEETTGVGSGMYSTVSSVSVKSWANGGVGVGEVASSVPSATLSHIFLT